MGVREHRPGRRRRSGDKAAAERQHAFRRAFERHGVVLDSELRAELVRRIQQDDPSVAFVARQSRRVTLWDVTVDDHTLRLVYDAQRHEIVSVLPPESPRAGP